MAICCTFSNNTLKHTNTLLIAKGNTQGAFHLLKQSLFKFLIDTFLTASGRRFGNVGTMNNIGKLLFR